ncbi:rCG22773 [Rattus norvegicus]|uniref:RCG22773 n=1 Tax=Rattus norvegicus TaxID=10116 RepID=A6JYB4_RAT|nr:rCG22773 [Rattus norvegicus]
MGLRGPSSQRSGAFMPVTFSGWKSFGSNNNCVGRRFSETRSPLILKKTFLLVALKETLKNVACESKRGKQR